MNCTQLVPHFLEIDKCTQRIENDQIVELCQVGGEGWLDVPSYLEDSPKVYDPETGEIREKTEAEIAGELDALVLEGAWSQLRGLRDSFFARDRRLSCFG